jgi:hypothetical protein
MSQTETTPTTARWAFGLALVWPAMVLVLRLDLLWLPGISGALRLALILAGAFVGSIGAISLGRRVRRAGLPGRDLATAAVTLGWIELALTIVASALFALLVYALGHSDLPY